MRKTLLYIILLMAVIMAGTVAYVSVGGLLKVFSGAGTLGVILFTSIEIAKVVATSAIHTYGKIIGWKYNLLLSLGVVIAMAITSMGIYGFLSSTYRESYSKMTNIESQIELNESKLLGYKGQLVSVSKEKDGLSTIISELSSGLSNNVIEYKDKETGAIIRTTSSSTRRALEKQLDRASERQELVSDKYDDISKKIFEIENEVLDIKLGNDAASELGPLKYLSEVTGVTMDNVMKWFIFLLIIIGDPMAILMVIIFNKVANVERKSNKKVKTPLIVEPPVIIKTTTSIPSEIIETKEDIEDLEEDIEELEEEIEEVEEEIIESLKEDGEVDDELSIRLRELEEKERLLKEKEDDVNRLDMEIKNWENTHWKLKRNRRPPSAIDEE